jgi:hypothetical protein
LGSESLSSNSSSQLEIFSHDSDSFSMDRTQVSIFKKTYEISFSRFLEGKYCWRLESEVTFELLGDLSHQSLEREFSEKEVSGLLVFSDLSQGDSAWSESVGFLYPTCLIGRGTFSCRLALHQLFSWSFRSSWFSGGLFGSGHFKN